MSESRRVQSFPAPALFAYECECCHLLTCVEKSKGIGYVCAACMGHYTMEEAVGMPGYPTVEQQCAQVEHDHENLRSVVSALLVPHAEAVEAFDRIKVAADNAAPEKLTAIKQYADQGLEALGRD